MPNDTQKEREEKLLEIKRQGEERSAQRIAEKLSLPYRRLIYGDVDRENMYIIARSDAEKGQIVVLSKEKNKLVVGVADPENQETRRVIEQLESQGFKVSKIVVSASSIAKAILDYEKVPPPPKTQEAGIVSIKNLERKESLEKVKEIISSTEGSGASDLLETILSTAISGEASDVHIEPEENQITVRLRLDGLLQKVGIISKKSYKLLLSRIKLLAGTRINVTDIPQSGRFTIKRKGKTEIEARTSILPGAYGEFVVVRILDPESIVRNVDQLGLRDDLWRIIKPQIERPNGIVLVTGPTGSGKTTTLYAFLRHLLKPEIKIITLEDPIEYHLEGVSQSQVGAGEKYTFAEGMKNALRQDPDVILVGEIRDEETAQTALNASLTGHFVFSTLHTNDAPGAIPRFLDLNAKPKILAPALNAVIAQRLVRVLCKNCKEAIKPSEETIKKIKNGLGQNPEFLRSLDFENLEIYQAVGCADCSGSGYRGRTGIFEVLVVNDKIEDLIGESPAHQEVLEEARKNGFLDMYYDGLLRVVEGETTIEEVDRIASALG